MTTAASDYAAAVAALSVQRLPAYVEYTREAYARGIAGANDPTRRIIVNVRTGKIVSVSPSTGDWTDDDGPVIRHVFNPQCYQATSERTISWNGRDALAIQVERTSPSCEQNIDVSTLYADPSTKQLLGADGSETEDGVTTDISVHYGTFGSYIMPTLVQAHVHGHGWLFWVRERAEVHYSNYTFTNERRQSGSPSG